MKFEELEEKYQEFEYEKTEDEEWSFILRGEVDFSVTLSLKCDIDELLSDESFVLWLNNQFEESKKLLEER